MPLSEDEQRILTEIEQQFYANDPGLAGEIGKHSVYAHSIRRMKLAVVVFVAAVVVLVVALALAVSLLITFGAFVVMLGAALWFEASLRRLGRAGMQQLGQAMRAGGLRDYFGATSDRLRTRIRREEGEADAGRSEDA
jgi:ABC-type multidrug transport system fused ATPase/permease subunit